MSRTHLSSILFASIGVCLLSLAACSGDEPTDNGDSRLPAIYGRVLDAAGNPVANAGVSLQFNYASHPPGTDSAKNIIVAPNPATTQTELHFNIQQSGPVTVTLLRADTRAIVDTLIEGILTAGQHSRLVDVSSLPNLRYIVQYNISNVSGEINLMVHNTELPITAPFTRTDANGHFIIPYASISIGKVFQRTFENGVSPGWLQISDLVDIAIDGPGTSDITWNLKVDTTAVIDSTLRLP
jgi:hypothetical protein